MNEVVFNLFIQAASDSTDIRAEAVLKIAMLLERHSTLRTSSEFYESIDVDMAHIGLDDAGQQEVITRLYELILTSPDNSSMIWALGKHNSTDVLDHLIDLICNHRDQMNVDGLEQALRALNRFSSVDENSISAHFENLPHGPDLQQALREITTHDNEVLAGLATRIIHSFRKLII